MLLNYTAVRLISALKPSIETWSWEVTRLARIRRLIRPMLEAIPTRFMTFKDCETGKSGYYLTRKSGVYMPRLKDLRRKIDPVWLAKVDVPTMLDLQSVSMSYLLFTTLPGKLAVLGWSCSAGLFYDADAAVCERLRKDGWMDWISSDQLGHYYAVSRARCQPLR